MTETGTMHEDCPHCGSPALRFWHGKYPFSHYACGTMANDKGREERTGECKRREATNLTCEACHKEPAAPLHTCPFKTEIRADETLCNCCKGCERNCRDDI